MSAFLPRVRVGRRLGQGEQGQTIQLTPEQLQQLIQAQASQGGGGGIQMTAPGQGQTIDAATTLVRNGAIVEMMLTVPASSADALKAQGQTIPEPKRVRMMVDTGASISGVKDEFATAAGLQATDSVQIGGVVGTETRPVYAARLVLTSDNMTFDPIEIVGLPLPGQTEIDGLLGRDFLKRASLVYSGSQGTFDIQPPAGDIEQDPWSIIGASVVALAAFGSLFWIAKKAR